MISKSTFLHLRFPFSFFLLPIFLFATFHTGELNTTAFWILFFLFHFLVYPASNGFNSFCDKDEGSIGGLKNPPKVHSDLLIWANIFDGLALVLALFISIWVGVGVLLYVLVSRAYSYPKVRLKKFPFLGLLSVAIFQGYGVFITSVMGMKGMNFEQLLLTDHFAGLISTAFLFGSYPMTQVYQHEEDEKAGVKTISILLGKKGTFVFTAIFFALTMGLYYLYFQYRGNLELFYWLLVF